MKIVVYCSSMEGLEKKYQQLAAALGTWIGQNGHTLLYGVHGVRGTGYEPFTEFLH